MMIVLVTNWKVIKAARCSIALRAICLWKQLHCHCEGEAEVETADSLQTKPWCLMAEGHLESKRLQLHYAKGHSAQSNLFWRLHFSVAICHSGVSLYFEEYQLDWTRQTQMIQKPCWTAIKQTPNQLSQVHKTMIPVLGYYSSIARPIIGLALLNYTIILQPRHYAIGWVRPCTGLIWRRRESNPRPFIALLD